MSIIIKWRTESPEAVYHRIHITFALDTYQTSGTATEKHGS